MRRLVFALSVAVAACASGEGDGASEAADEVVAASAPRPPERASRPVPGSPVQPLDFQCRSDAFCEDFESADPSARWTGESGAGLLFGAPSASRGARSLRVATDAPAFLVEKGRTSMAGALAVALRLDAAPSSRIGGPAIVVGDASIVIALEQGGVVLEQRDAWCASCRKRSDLVATAPPGAWHFVVLGFEVDDAATAAPYGRLEIGVDGGDLSTVALEVPLYGAKVELHAGVTTADAAGANGNTLAIDDVMFLLH